VHVVVHNHFRAKDSVNVVPKALQQAQRIDPLKYLEGVKRIVLAPDRDDWNAKYDPKTDEIILERKFANKTFSDMVLTLLHEGGHRGQSIDPDTYKEFKARGLNQKSYFLAMANVVHQRKGTDNIAEEVFAESYARFALKADMPEALRKFWQERIK
jgi:hypothetical protein